MADDTKHAARPLVTAPIKWGDFASERGVLVGGSLCGLFRNTRWLPPPTEPDASPPRDKLNGWNTRPSDQYVPDGIRPRGPFRYTFNGAVRREDDKNESGSGIFWASIPPGRSSVITKVNNPTAKAATLRVDVNDLTGHPVEIPPGQTLDITAAIPPGTSDVVGVRYTGGRELVIVQTTFAEGAR
jgi:hypothetical protein